MNGDLRHATYETLPGFNLQVPTEVPGVDRHLLDPRKTWVDQVSHDNYSRLLMEKFIENFKKFKVNQSIIDAGPHLA